MTYIYTCLGRKFDFTSPPTDFPIEEIARPLSAQCRFNGHCKEHYSVAEHCILAAAIPSEGLTARERLSILLHDAEEAYCGDMARPLKHLLRGANGASAYEFISDEIRRAILLYHHADPLFDYTIADRMMMVWEWERVFRTPPDHTLEGDFENVRIPTTGMHGPFFWSAEKAEDEFLYTYHRLRSEMVREEVAS